jgi:hypothetical protein
MNAGTNGMITNALGTEFTVAFTRDWFLQWRIVRRFVCKVATKVCPSSEKT